LKYFAGPSVNLASEHESRHDRQLRAFGADGQASISRLNVGVVGLGGTGSFVAQQLAHLGVARFILIDDDVVEISNLNRLIGARPDDVGQQKVTIAERNIKTIQPNASAVKVFGSVLNTSVAKALLDADIFFCCTDSHGSRAVLNQLAYQYYIPCIDMGVSIGTKAGTVTHITGRVQMLSPGLGCLTCGGTLDPDAVRRDLMTDAQRQADPYFIGQSQPAPAVVSINGTVASLAVTMFLGAVTNIPANARYQVYNAITGNIRSVESISDPSCIVCSRRGALGQGNSWPLPARQE
jgi:molybdopterin/thiamine biosynthesis adenylyltransferase